MLHLCPNFNQYLPHMESIRTLFYANFNQCMDVPLHDITKDLYPSFAMRSAAPCMQCLYYCYCLLKHNITMAVVWALDTWHYVMAQGGFRPRAFSTAFSTACLVYPTTIKRLRLLPSPSPLSSLLLLSLPVPLLIFVFHLAHTSLSQEHLPSIFPPCLSVQTI